MTFYFDIPNGKRLGEDYKPTIYYVDDEKRELEEVEGQQLDTRNKTVYVNPTHFSKYVLLDKYERQQVIDQNSRLLEENNKAYSQKNIAFAIDSSGSMEDNDKDDVRKTVVKEFIDTLLEKDKISVIDFDSHGRILQNLTSDKELAKKSVDLIDSRGGTDIAQGVEKSLATLIDTKDTKVDDDTVLNAIILLTDGDGYYNNSLTQKAIENNVKIYTIGLGKDINERTLKDIAYKTKWQYYHVSSIDKLKKEFMNLNKLITIDKTIDSDNDGLTDWEEENTIDHITLLPYKLNKNNPDTDGDGLLDGEEIVYDRTSEKNSVDIASVVMPWTIGKVLNKKNILFKNTYISNPTNPDSDNDAIGDKDDKEPNKYNISDYTLALAAKLSYTNLEKYDVGKKVGYIDKFPRIEKMKDFVVLGHNRGNYTLFWYLAIYEKDKKIFDEIKKAKNYDEYKEKIKKYLSTEGFFDDAGLDTLVLKIDKNILYVPRGTNQSSILDWNNNIWSYGASINMQSYYAYKQYALLEKNYKNYKNFYFSGHSLGGRIVQDLIYSAKEDNISIPVRAATFNALGYKEENYNNLDEDIKNSIKSIINNYSIEKDPVTINVGQYRLGNKNYEFPKKNQTGMIYCHNIDRFINFNEKRDWKDFDIGKIDVEDDIPYMTLIRKVLE